jgi:hypothetical protein
VTPSQVAAILAAISALVPAGWITAVSNQIANNLSAADAQQVANDIVTDVQFWGADVLATPAALQQRGANAGSGSDTQPWNDDVGTSNVFAYCASTLPNALAAPNDWTGDN